MKTVYLKGVTWDVVKEVIVIILPPYQIIYQLQMSQRPHLSNFYNYQGPQNQLYFIEDQFIHQKYY